MAAGLSILILAQSGMAMPSTPIERVKVFAACAGRLSALEEQQRLFDGALSEQTAAQKSLFDTLISATLPDARKDGVTGRQALGWQVDAKMAQAVLLQQAVFGTDTDQAQRARRTADQYVKTCKQLILGA